MPSLKVADIMTEHVLTVKENLTLKEVAHVLLRYRISGVPVVSRKGCIVGIITITDLLRVLSTDLKPSVKDEIFLIKKLQNKKVKDVMTKNVFTLDKKVSIWKAFKVMCEKNIHTLPVVENSRLIGVVGVRDLLNICLNV